MLSFATHQYYDMPQEPGPEERGLPWASRHTGLDRTFKFNALNIYDNIDFSLNGKHLDKKELCKQGHKVQCLEIRKPENIIGTFEGLLTE